MISYFRFEIQNKNKTIYFLPANKQKKILSILFMFKF